MISAGNMNYLILQYNGKLIGCHKECETFSTFIKIPKGYINMGTRIQEQKDLLIRLNSVSFG